MINVLQVPIKLPIKATNAVIIFDDPLTIIDPGCRGELTLELFEKELSLHGKSLKDVERILITHGHIDHFGAAEDIREISNADIYIHEDDFEKACRQKDEGLNEFRSVYKDTLLKHGSTNEGLVGLDNFLHYIDSFYSPITRYKPYKNTVDFDTFSLDVIETPGHTRGSVVFYSKDKDLLISGDTLIKDISPNPIIEYIDKGLRFDSRSSFKESVKSLVDFKVTRIIPGHGQEIYDLNALYKKYKSDWNKRENAMLNVLKQKESISAFEMTEELFGKLKGFDIFLGMSEIIGYFDYFNNHEITKYINHDNIIKAQLVKK